MKDLTNICICHVNATKQGGGVAELLQSLVPELNEQGIEATWFVPSCPPDFYNITTKFHAALQGIDTDITLKEIERYLEVCESIGLPNADLYIIHDPQPLPIKIPEGAKSIWRFHIECTDANKILMSILSPYINKHDAIIITDKKYLEPHSDKIDIPIFEISPTIDLNNPKNHQHTGQYAQMHLDLPKDVPIISCVSRFDIFKGQEDLIKAFKLLNHPTAHLVLLGNFAADNVEGEVIFNYLKTRYASKTIHIIALNDIHAVGSLMALSDVYVQFSSKEGFGLVVAEAMNQGTLTIGSNVGGIPKQVIDNETGLLVESGNIEQLTKKIQYALDNPDEMITIANQGKEYIQNTFTLTQLVKNHLSVYEEVLKL